MNHPSPEMRDDGQPLSRRVGNSSCMKALLFIITISFLLFIFVRFLEYKSLYYPFRTIEMTPEEIGLAYETVTLTAGDGVQISGWFIPAESSRGTVLFAHGNGGNISHRLDKIRILNDLNANTFIFDYRGYGMSKGRPSETGLYRDAQAAYEYLVNEKKIPSGEIIGYGESLGGAVIISLAENHELGGLIIESAFTSVRDMGKRIFPFIPEILYKSRFDSLSRMQNIRYPMLIMHSRDDEIVPYDMGKRLFEAAGTPKKFVELRGGHNDGFLVSKKLYMRALDSFLGSIRGRL